MMTRFARMGRDACVTGVGVLTAFATPPSVTENGLTGALGVVWSLMLLLGGLASLYGVIRQQFTPEVVGCTFVGGGFFVWAFASVAQPNPTATSYALALVFLSGTFGQLYRVTIVSRGRHPHD